MSNPVTDLVAGMTQVLQGGSLPPEAAAHQAAVQAAQQNESNSKPNVVVVAPRNEVGEFISDPSANLSAAAMLREAEINGPDAILNQNVAEPAPVAPVAPITPPVVEQPALVRLADGTEVPAELAMSAWQKYQEQLLNPIPAAPAQVAPTADVFSQKLAEIEQKRAEAEVVLANAGIVKNLNDMLAAGDYEGFQRAAEYLRQSGTVVPGFNAPAHGQRAQAQGDDAPLTIGAWKQMQADEARARADAQVESDRKLAHSTAISEAMKQYVTEDKTLTVESARKYVQKHVALEVMAAEQRGALNKFTNPNDLKAFMQIAAMKGKQAYTALKNEIFGTTAQANAPAQQIPRSPTTGVTPMPTAPQPLDWSKKVSPTDLARAAMGIANGSGSRG